ncbi:ABC transporter substrate-binding protein [Corynebacterium cystitidis]|uniref:Iron complex transport system substrate-binding protein n=1 Tax=Corynebacterium cystitidis DSM 20524 TaxID=1121357 RepID=A0A1H9NVI2_9CORY|nr:ABC transporter substrate-binding protein [Corynebacterium cystitidis]WJY82719.1 Periplasmic binding protein [Corynebacterium cystitidis DSM 20524]SER39797.1 iron complex transport system substrate-binding protein [Corynebacterium cystitidis DSM 20524]SNV71397.1 periplasmic binding protein [Corynebacterium cystitidis]
MKSKITKSLFASVLAAALALTSGCSSTGGSSSTAESSGSSTSPAVGTSESETRVITDALGREVEVPARVDEIATHGTAARMVIYAGGIEKLSVVAEGDQRENVAMPYAYVHHGELKDLPVGTSGKSADPMYEEQIIELSPDIIVSSSADAGFLDEMQERTGVPVVALYETIVQNNVFDEEIIRMIELLGELMGTEEQASNVTTAMKKWGNDLDERVGDIPEKERVTAYTGAVNFNGSHGIAGSYARYMPFDLVNVINVVDETGQEGAFQIDLEKLQDWDPDLIFLNPSNMDLVNEDYNSNPEFFNSLTAVENNGVYSQPPYIMSGTNFELAIADTYYVGKVAYPDRFEDIDMRALTDEVFEVLLGQKYSDKLIEAGLWFNPLELGEDPTPEG